MVQRTNPIAAACRRARTLDKLDLRNLLPTIRTPILFIGGNRIVPWPRAAVLANHLPNVRRVEFIACGHSPQDTHAAAGEVFSA